MQHRENEVHGEIGFAAEAPVGAVVKRADLLRQLDAMPDLLALPAPRPLTRP